MHVVKEKNKLQELQAAVIKLKKQIVGQIEVVSISAHRYPDGKFKMHVRIAGIPKEVNGYEVCLEHGGKNRSLAAVYSLLLSSLSFGQL